MRSTLRLFFLACALAGVFVVAAPGVASAPTVGYIAVLDPGSDPTAVAAAAQRDHGVSVSHVYEHALRGFAFRGSAQAAAAMARAPGIAYVSPDLEVSITGKPDSGGTVQPAQVTPTGVRRIGGAGAATGGAGVGVAIIDTGIQLNHPDLPGARAGVNCVRPGKAPTDDNGHGTHVAGTIGAAGNAVGVVGVAPEARLYAVKVLNAAGSGTWSSVICGIDWVTANAGTIRVANMSLGGSGDSSTSCNGGDALHAAICGSVAAGVTYVVSAGNSALDSTGFVPAGYDEVITVSALADFDGASGGGAAATCRSDVDDTFADFSNWGADVDIAAPGVCILSTWKGSTYNTISGTSMASPHVAGAAALYLAGHAGALPASVKNALIAGAEAGPITGDPDSSKEGVLHIGP